LLYLGITIASFKPYPCAWSNTSIMNKHLLAILLLLMFHIAVAQNHYWSQQYGGQATLTGGTAVAGAVDYSAIFYNPGGIGFIDSARFTASTYIYGIEYNKLNNGAGDNLHLKSLRVNIIPQLLAGRIRIKKEPKLKLVYGTLTRSRSNVRFTLENENQYEIIPGSPGLENYKARLEFVNNSVEQWAGIGLAYQLNEHWSVGLSSFTVYTHMEVRSTLNTYAEGLNQGVPYIATVNEYNAMRLNQFSQLFKLGLAARFKHLQLGLALTLPGIKVWGEGKLEKSFEAYNLNQQATDTSLPAQKYPSYVISDAQSRLTTNYKIPLSLSVGMKWVYPKFSIAASLEYFMGYRQHLIMQGTNRAVIRPAGLSVSDTLQDYLRLATSASWVINAGLGAEVKLKPNLNLLLGIRTDFNNRTDYLPNNSTLNILPVRSPMWHYLYLSSGLTYKLALHHLTAGFDYGIGLSGNHQQMFNLSEPRHSTYLRGDVNNTMTTAVHKLNFILSYTYFFKPREKNFGPLSIIDELNKKKKRSLLQRKN
jgi:hypothetical protein